MGVACTSCGSVNLNNAKFCVNCGMRMKEEAEPLINFGSFSYNPDDDEDEIQNITFDDPAFSESSELLSEPPQTPLESSSLPPSDKTKESDMTQLETFDAPEDFEAPKTDSKLSDNNTKPTTKNKPTPTVIPKEVNMKINERTSMPANKPAEVAKKPAAATSRKPVRPPAKVSDKPRVVAPARPASKPIIHSASSPVSSSSAPQARIEEKTEEKIEEQTERPFVETTFKDVEYPKAEVQFTEIVKETTGGFAENSEETDSLINKTEEPEGTFGLIAGYDEDLGESFENLNDESEKPAKIKDLSDNEDEVTDIPDYSRDTEPEAAADLDVSDVYNYDSRFDSENSELNQKLDEEISDESDNNQDSLDSQQDNEASGISGYSCNDDSDNVQNHSEDDETETGYGLGSYGDDGEEDESTLYMSDDESEEFDSDAGAELLKRFMRQTEDLIAEASEKAPDAEILNQFDFSVLLNDFVETPEGDNFYDDIIPYDYYIDQGGGLFENFDSGVLKKIAPIVIGALVIFIGLVVAMIYVL